MSEKVKKTGVVKTIFETDREPDKYGNKSFNISFEDGTRGLYTGKKETYFARGSEVEYDCEEREKKTKPGEFWNKISIPSKGDYKSKEKSYSKKSDPERDSQIIRTVAHKATVKLMTVGRFQSMDKAYNTIQKALLDFMVTKHNEKGNIIAAESAVALAVEQTLIPAFEIEDLKAVIERSEQLYQNIIKPLNLE